MLLAGRVTLLPHACFLTCKRGVMTLQTTLGCDEDEGGYRTVLGTWQPGSSWGGSEKQDQYDSRVPFLEQRLYARCKGFLAW